MKKLIYLASIVLISVTALISTCHGQPIDPVNWHYKQKKANWLFEYDTVRINCLRIDNKLAIDSLGRIWWYNNSGATLGNILVGNGTYYNPLSIGTSGQVFTVVGGTGAWADPAVTAGDITGLTENLFLYGAADGSVEQDDEGHYDPATNILRLGDPLAGDVGNPGTIIVTDGVSSGGMNAQQGISYSSSTNGEMFINGKTLQFMDLSGHLFNIGRATWTIDENLYFPAAKGSSGQSFYVSSVAGDDVILGWYTPTTGTVTSVSGTDGNGFDFTVTNPTTTPAIALTTTITDDRIMYSNSGALGSAAGFLYNDVTELFTVGNFTVLGADGIIKKYAGSNGADGIFPIGNTIDGVFYPGTITSSDLTIGYSNPNITISIPTNAVALGTQTTGNYAAGDAEAGNATGLACTDCVALTTETTGNYAAGDAEAGNATGVACTDCIALTTETSGNYVTSIATTAPLAGGAAGSEGATLTLSMPAAATAQDGYLSSTNWNTFNNKGYTLILTGSQGTVVDNTTYFSGAITTGTSTSAAINQVPIPVSGTITDIIVYQLTAGTLATGESSELYIRYDNTTDVTVSTSVLNSSASSTWSATGLSQAVTAGHYIELKFKGNVNWSTNPSNVRWTAVVYIK